METTDAQRNSNFESEKKLKNIQLPSLQRPKSAIFTKPSVSSNKLSNFKSLFRIKRYSMKKKSKKSVGYTVKKIIAIGTVFSLY